MELVGGIIAAFYEIRNNIWRKLWVTESFKFGIENTSVGIKTGENEKPEELSNARNTFGQDNNEGKNFDNEKHCKTLFGVPISSNEMQSHNKNCISQDQKRLANKYKKC